MDISTNILMILVVERYWVHAANTSLRPVGRSEVLCSWRPLFVDLSPTSNLPVGDNKYKLEGLAKTCRRTVGDCSPMGGDLHTMVGDSCMISVDLMPTDCGPLEVRPVLD